MNTFPPADARLWTSAELDLRAKQIQKSLGKFKKFGTFPTLMRHAATAALVLASYLISTAIEGVSHYPLFMFTLPIILVSFLFDRKAGYFASFLGGLVVFLFFMTPRFPLASQDIGKLIAVGAFILVGLITAYIIEAMRVTIDIFAENAALKERQIELEKELFHAKKIEAVGQAVSILAHDFRNILTPLDVIAATLRTRIREEDENTLKALNALQTVYRNGNRLCCDISAFGRNEKSQNEPLNLNKVLREELPALRHSIKEDVRVELIPTEGIRDIYADRALLVRALANILDNAQDAMPDGGTITIRTSTEKVAETDRCISGRCSPGERVCLAIQDTGTGIPPDIREKIFEPFFTTKPSGKGTGLGMAMVADFMRHARGCIALDSSLDQGTTIRLYFPPFQ